MDHIGKIDVYGDRTKVIVEFQSNSGRIGKRAAGENVSVALERLAADLRTGYANALLDAGQEVPDIV